MNKISIIIPVYNVQSYIRKCLDSVINQTYSNLEIICINDGSTDDSGVICDAYAKMDSRVKVVHKTNGGNASAINAGLDIMTGDYVGFVDPDDWIEMGFYENAYELITSKDADIACFGWIKDTEESSIAIKNQQPISNGKLSREQILVYTFVRDIYPAFSAYRWNKLFRAQFFLPKAKSGDQIRANEAMKVGSDVLFFTECALKAKSAVYNETAYYHYFQRASSLFHSKDLEKRRGSLMAYRRILELLDGNNIDRSISIWVKRFYVYHASLLTEIAFEIKDRQNLILLQEEMIRYEIEYLETNREFPDRVKRFHELLALRC